MLYAFRSIEEDGTTSQHGVVTANNMTELFLALDEHVDPRYVEVKKIKQISFCVDTSPDPKNEGDESYFNVGVELEFGDSFFESLADNDGWYTPNFKGIYVVDEYIQ